MTLAALSSLETIQHIRELAAAEWRQFHETLTYFGVVQVDYTEINSRCYVLRLRHPYTGRFRIDGTEYDSQALAVAGAEKMAEAGRLATFAKECSYGL